MQAKPKSNSVVTSAWDMVAGLLTLAVVGIPQVIKFDVRKWVGEKAYDSLNDNGKRVIGHGITQRISDRAAIGRDSTTGQSATPAEKHAAMQSLVTHYEGGGAWELKGDGLKPLDRAAIYGAVAAVRKLDAVKVEAAYRAKEDSVLRTLLTIPSIAAEYAKRTARGASEVGNDLLKELDAIAQ